MLSPSELFIARLVELRDIRRQEIEQCRAQLQYLMDREEDLDTEIWVACRHDWMVKETAESRGQKSSRVCKKCKSVHCV